ncbi:MAG: flagellar basal body rod protein FlgB [Magnetococcales bacterium]|nr:flagellar basal body rod protein FlgB [Magnetococcales bacterium]
MPGFGLLGVDGAYKKNLMDLRQRRQEIIGANIANADTPGYKAKRLDFEDELKKSLPAVDEMAMARTDGRHMPVPFFEPSDGEQQAVEIPIPRGDRNSVDVEQEMARQSANQLLYNYAGQALSSQISELRMVIDGGGATR